MSFDLKSFAEGIFKPFSDLVDNVHTSTEEKLALRNKLAEITQAIELKLLELQKAVLDARQAIILAEANGQSWLQRNWRPVTMINFLVLINLDYFGILTHPLSERVWDVITYGLSGYVVGRSGEKIAGKIAEAFKSTTK